MPPLRWRRVAFGETWNTCSKSGLTIMCSSPPMQGLKSKLARLGRRTSIDDCRSSSDLMTATCQSAPGKRERARLLP